MRFRSAESLQRHILGSIRGNITQHVRASHHPSNTAYAACGKCSYMHDAEYYFSDLVNVESTYAIMKRNIPA